VYRADDHLAGRKQPCSQDLFFPFFKFGEFKKGKKSWERGWGRKVKIFHKKAKGG